MARVEVRCYPSSECFRNHQAKGLRLVRIRHQPLGHHQPVPDRVKLAQTSQFLGSMWVPITRCHLGKEQLIVRVFGSCLRHCHNVQDDSVTAVERGYSCSRHSNLHVAGLLLICGAWRCTERGVARQEINSRIYFPREILNVKFVLRCLLLQGEQPRICDVLQRAVTQELD